MHFELQAGTDSDSGDVWTMRVRTAEPYGRPSKVVEIEMAISKLKKGKASGHDKIPAELMKERGKNLKKVIYELMLKIWEEEIIPHEWKYGIMCPNDMKGDVVMWDNYRAVTLLCTAYKILVNILYV
jgi:hypothetical protein